MDSKEPPSVSVIIPTHNRVDWLPRVLSRIEALDYPDYEIIVVDDGSEDDTDALLKEWTPQGIRSIRHDQPRGPSAARNSGVAIAKGEIVAFIDDDAIPESDWLQQLVSAYTYEKIGAVGGAVYHLGTGHPQSTGVKANRFGRDSALTAQGLAPREFMVLIECNMSVRKKVFEQVGGFDSAIKIYGEGTDLCIRIARAGYDVLYTPRAVVWHAKATGPYRGNLYHPYRNRIYLSLKSFGSPLHLVQLFVYDTGILLGNMALQLYWLLTRQTTRNRFRNACRQMIEARIDGYPNGLRAWRSKRPS
jgi:glycogen(starch) synthase